MEGLLQDQGHAYVLKDERQSTIFILDQEREIKNQYRYDAFGVDAGKTEVIENRILYTGQQYDDVAEQYYLRARYYNPVIGRFLQEDVYRGDGLNLYAYCGNNPVEYFDPSGYSKDPRKYGMGGNQGMIPGPNGTLITPEYDDLVYGGYFGRKNDRGQKPLNKVEIPKNVLRQMRKLSPEARIGLEKALNGLRNGDFRGLKNHPLTGNRAGQWAVDIKGIGSGRGGGRIIYEYVPGGGINIIEIFTDHSY